MPRRQTGITKYKATDGHTKWQYVLDQGPDPITGARRQRRKRSFDTSAAASTALATAKREITLGTYVEPTTLTLGSYLMSWLDSPAVTGKAPKTASSYRQIMTQYVIPHIGQIPLQKLTAIALDDLYALLLESGGARSNALGNRSVRLTHTVLSTALSSAERKGLINRNVARFADPPSAKSAKAPEPETWTPAELRSFLDATTDHRLGTLFHLAALTGMRRGEICGLAWDNLDLDVGEVRVRRALILVDGAPQYGPPKSTQSRRTVNIDAETVAVMRRYRRAQKEARLLAGEGWEDTGLVFTGPTGQYIHPDNVTTDFKKAVVAMKGTVAQLHLHGLRHTHTTHLLAAGVNPRVVSERLGHHSVAFTLDVYGHVMPGQQADAAAAVAALLNSSTTTAH